MNPRRLAALLVLNALVAVAATWAALYAWERWVRPAALAAPAAASPTAASNIAPLAATALPPSTPLVHTVLGGETLGSIAQQYDVPVDDLMAANGLSDPNLLAVGQQLVIPLAAVAPAAPPTAPLEATAAAAPPLATATPLADAPAPVVTVREVQAAGDLANETAVIANSGGPVDLAGWTLSDGAGRVYIFPALTLFQGGVVYVHTGSGQDSVIDLFWGQAAPAWGPGRALLLADAAGRPIAQFTVP